MVLSIGMVARRVMAEGKDAKIAVRPVLREALAPHIRGGWVRLDARIWLLTATAELVRRLQWLALKFGSVA